RRELDGSKCGFEEPTLLKPVARGGAGRRAGGGRPRDARERKLQDAALGELAPHVHPRPVVGGLLLHREDLPGVVVGGALPLDPRRRRGIELLPANQGDIVALALPPLRDQLVVDLPSAEDDAAHAAAVLALESRIAEHAAEGAPG